MKRAVHLLLATAVVAALVVSGCTVAKISGKGVTPVMVNNPNQKVDLIKHFNVSKGITFDWTSSFDASEIVADVIQETGADAIVNVSFKVQQTPGDFFINLFTLGIANAMHLIVEGDAVKTPNGLSAADFGNGSVVASSDKVGDLINPMLLGTSDGGSKYAIVCADGGYQLVLTH